MEILAIILCHFLFCIILLIFQYSVEVHSLCPWGMNPRIPVTMSSHISIYSSLI